MGRIVRFASVLLILWVAISAWPDYVTVSRQASLKLTPEPRGAVICICRPGDLYRLLENEQTYGYYHVDSYSGGHAGWIYRTFVRRYPGDPEGEIPATADREEAPYSEGPSLAAGPLSDASAYAISGCPPEGNAKKQSVRLSNPLKNRLRAPASAAIHPLSIEAILAPGDDHDRWNEDEAAEVIGWVKTVKPGGPETCNCRTNKPEDWDTHIELTLQQGEQDSRKVMIVEVTPPWRRLMATVGQDWSTTTLRRTLVGRQVRVTGWLFFDAEHEHQSENTEPDGDRNWRGTAWEIHPITSLETLDGQVH